jgi:hypothetical protein
VSRHVPRQRWIEDSDLEDPEIAQMVSDAAGGIRGSAAEIEHDEHLRPTAGLPAPSQED